MVEMLGAFVTGGAAVMIGVGALAVCWSQRRTIQQLQDRLGSMERELAQISDTGIGVGRRVVALDRRLKVAERRQQEIEATDPERIGYNEAMKLLSLGAEIDDLIANCGLSRAEAELMSALYLGQTSRHK